MNATIRDTGDTTPTTTAVSVPSNGPSNNTMTPRDTHDTSDITIPYRLNGSSMFDHRPNFTGWKLP